MPISLADVAAFGGVLVPLLLGILAYQGKRSKDAMELGFEKLHRRIDNVAASSEHTKTRVLERVMPEFPRLYGKLDKLNDKIEETSRTANEANYKVKVLSERFGHE